MLQIYNSCSWSKTEILSTILQSKYFWMIKFFEPIFSALNFDSNALQISFGDLIMWKDHRFNLEEWWVVPLQTSSFSICFFLSPLFLQNLHHLLWEIALNLGARHKLSRLSEKNFILSFHLVKLVPSNQSSFTNSWFNIFKLVKSFVPTISNIV